MARIEGRKLPVSLIASGQHVRSDRLRDIPHIGRFHPHLQAALRDTLAIRRCDHDHVTVEIPDPEFPMPRVRVDVDVADDVGFKVPGPKDHFVEIIDFEPEQNSIADGLVDVAKRTMMVISIPVVQLQDQPVTPPLARVVPWVPKPLIFGSAMPADAAE
ncbi:hypothetical protein [Bradyrhizobium manausense]|uniref:hypothetical protein n=1 Tax=Bradyrhizobium manausense TaxID=989370 RepID=UPI00196AADD3|nr:hypothetical protein [Bradyrhizobium manausense]